jgi:hypothetical protein
MNSPSEEFMNMQPTEQGNHNRNQESGLRGQESEVRSQKRAESAGQGSPEPQAGELTTAQELKATLWSKRFSLVVFGVLTMVFVTSIMYRPAEVNPNEEYSTICGFKNLTGLPCPGCGLTHSFCEIGKGHMASAVAWNWLGIPLFLLLILIWLKALLVLGNQYRPAFALDRLAARVRLLRLTAISFAVYGIGRIVYIFLYNPSARGSNPLSKLLGLLGG